MEHWEYLAVKFEHDGRWKDSSGRTGQLNKKDHDQGYASLVELLNGLGSAGWELIINNAYSMGSGFGTLMFKRQEGQ